MAKKVVLAYSGGLDTSVAIKWFVNRGYEVIAYMADVGQNADYSVYKKRALATGASKVIVDDLKSEFVSASSAGANAGSASPNAGANAGANAGTNASAGAGGPGVGATDVRALLRRTDANHLQVGPFQGEAVDRPDALSEIGFGLSNVEMLDKLLAADRSAGAQLKPVVLHFSSFADGSELAKAWTQVFPMLSRLGAMTSPVIGVVDAPLDLHEVLPVLFCKRRVMYETASLRLHVVYDWRPSWMLCDIYDNSTLLLEQVKTILRERTRLPADIIANLDRRRVSLTPADCLRYGIVDTVLPVLRTA